MTEIGSLELRNLSRELHVHYFYDKYNKLQRYEMSKIPLFIEKIYNEGNMYVNYICINSEVLKDWDGEKNIIVHTYVEMARHKEKIWGLK